MILYPGDGRESFRYVLPGCLRREGADPVTQRLQTARPGDNPRVGRWQSARCEHVTAPSRAY